MSYVRMHAHICVSLECVRQCDLSVKTTVHLPVTLRRNEVMQRKQRYNAEYKMANARAVTSGS